MVVVAPRQWEASRSNPQAKILKLPNGDGTKHPVKSAFFLPVSDTSWGKHRCGLHPDVPQQHSRCYHLAKEEMFGLNPKRSWFLFRLKFPEGAVWKHMWLCRALSLMDGPLRTVDEDARSEEDVRNDPAHCHRSRSQGSDLCDVFCSTINSFYNITAATLHSYSQCIRSK